MHCSFQCNLLNVKISYAVAVISNNSSKIHNFISNKYPIFLNEKHVIEDYISYLKVLLNIQFQCIIQKEVEKNENSSAER